MYHDVNEAGTRVDIYSLPVSQFVEGVSALALWARAHGHPFVPLTATPRPGIALTFDDGYRSTISLAAPILTEHSIPFSVFVTQSFVDSDSKYLTTADLRTLASLPGVVLGTHGVSHSQFAELDERALRNELSLSRDWLEQLTGAPVTSMSYPHGSHTQRVGEIARECGYTTAACSSRGTFTDAAQLMRIPRIDIWSRDAGASIIEKTRGDWDRLLP
jgi:peptidoglycan/xylan/chitin deacetylase (PgdA/CDA1 family)